MKYLKNSYESANSLTALKLAELLIEPGSEGHFNELNSVVTSTNKTHSMSSNWETFFSTIGSQGIENLNFKEQDLRNSVKENGVTYNVYADEDGPQRPWALDIFPLIIDSVNWQKIAYGVSQRAQLLELMMKDIYGPQNLIKEGLIPPALIQGHPGYLRSMYGANLSGKKHLHILAFDLAKTPSGEWSVIAQRTQAPSGLGYLLENRNLISRQFPNAFEKMNIEPLADTYREFIDALKLSSPAGINSNIVLLTPGPYNETYFEQAYLARFLGLTLVEGTDLTVRNQRVYLRTLGGLEQVHIILKRLDDSFLDPLELRPDSTLGIPGILQAIRLGNVLIANAPGSAFLESPALLGFLPAINEKLLGQHIELPAFDTWWCGESAALQSAMANIHNTAIKPTYPNADGHISFPAILTKDLSPIELQKWIDKIHLRPNEYTVQNYLPLAQMPTWEDSSIIQKSYVLRVFALSNGENSWNVLTGGLVRIASKNDGIASMQRGGSSADVWVQTNLQSQSSGFSNLHQQDTNFHKKRVVTSRASENLFWFGRYSERSENTIRLARLYLKSLNNEYHSTSSIWPWVEKLCKRQSLVPIEVQTTYNSEGIRNRQFEKELIESLHDGSSLPSVGFNLLAMQRAASSVRERLATEQWAIIHDCVDQFRQDIHRSTLYKEYSTNLAMEALSQASKSLAAITGGQTDRMTRDDGWQLLSIGRYLERILFLSDVILDAIEQNLFDNIQYDVSGFDGLLYVFDSTITYHSQHQQNRNIKSLIDLILIDHENPRSLSWIMRHLENRINKLNSINPSQTIQLNYPSMNSDSESIQALCEVNHENKLLNLSQHVQTIKNTITTVADDINATYFSHIYKNNYRL